MNFACKQFRDVEKKTFLSILNGRQQTPGDLQGTEVPLNYKLHKAEEQIRDCPLVDSKQSPLSMSPPPSPSLTSSIGPDRSGGGRPIFSLPLIDTVHPSETSARFSVLSKMRARRNSQWRATLWDTAGYSQPDIQSSPGFSIVSFK